MALKCTSMKSQKLSTMKKIQNRLAFFLLTSQRQVASKGTPRVCWWCSPAGPLVWQKVYWERTYQNFSTGRRDSCKPSSWINDLGGSVPGAEVSSVLTGITAQPKRTDGHAGSGRADGFHCQWQTLSMKNKKHIFSKGESGSGKSPLSSPGNCCTVHFRHKTLQFCEIRKILFYSREINCMVEAMLSQTGQKTWESHNVYPDM